MTLLVPLGIILLLVILNGLFVAAEFAIVGAPKTVIDHMAANGDALARRVSWILEDPKRQDRYIATTQIGISVASLGLGMYGEHVLAEAITGWLEPWASNRWIAAHAIASVLAVTFLTYLHIVVGEMVPKALALQQADRTALYVSPLIQALQTAIKPLVVALNGIGNGVLALLGVRRQEGAADRYHTTEELQFIIQESQEGGLLRGESGSILRELFEFGDLTAGEVMVPRVRLVGLRTGTTPDELRHVIRTSPHTRYPVYVDDLDRIVGSFHIRDALRHLLLDQPMTLRDARPLPYIPETAPLDEVLAAMRRYRAQMAVVMDEHGGTAGIVTIEDLFEEVVGDIEEGRSQRSITRDPAGRVVVRGTVRLEEAGQALGVVLEHEDVSTVSGLVLAQLGRPAVPGDVVVWGNVRIEVTTAAGRGVGTAVMTLKSEPGPDRTPR